MSFFNLTFSLLLLRRENEWGLVGTWQPATVNPSHWSTVTITFLLGRFKGSSAFNIQIKLTIWNLWADSIMIRDLMLWRGESSRTGGDWLYREPTSRNEQYSSLIGKYPFSTSKYQSSSDLTQFLLLGLLDCYYRSLTKRHQVLAIKSLTSCTN